jgi:hypothetical protein
MKADDGTHFAPPAEPLSAKVWEENLHTTKKEIIIYPKKLLQA